MSVSVPVGVDISPGDRASPAISRAATLTFIRPRDRDGDGSMLEGVEFAAKVADELLVQVDPERLRRRDGKEGFDRPRQLEPEPVVGYRSG